MVLEKLTPYIKDYLQKEWSDFWNVTYDESEDKIECVWNGMDSTTIEFTYDAENENLLFYSKEPQPVEDLVEMLAYLNNKVQEIFEELSQNQER